MTKTAGRWRYWSSIASFCVSSAWLTYPSVAPAAIQVVVRTGDDSPDGNGDLQLLNAPSINSAGQLAFVAQLNNTSGGMADNVGLIRRDTNGALTMVARRGNLYDGKSIVTFFPASAYMLGDGTVLSVVAAGSPAAFFHVYGSGGPLTPMYTTSMQSPSGQNNMLLGVLSATVNASGVAVYRAIFNGPQVESGYYQRSPDGTQSVRFMNQVPSARGGTITSGGGRPTLNEAGQIGTILSIDTGAPSSVHAAARIDGTTLHEFV